MRRKPNTFLIAGLVGLIGLACYPIIIEPMLNTEKYSECCHFLIPKLHHI